MMVLLPGFAIGQPCVTVGLGVPTQTSFEAFDNLKTQDNLSLLPVLSLVTNANNDSSNGTILQDTFRTVISF